MNDLEKLKKELDDLNEREFYLDMKDHWGHEDYIRSDKLSKQEEAIKEKIKELENA